MDFATDLSPRPGRTSTSSRCVVKSIGAIQRHRQSAGGGRGRAGGGRRAGSGWAAGHKGLPAFLIPPPTPDAEGPKLHRGL